jgi:hypothetical protein
MDEFPQHKEEPAPESSQGRFPRPFAIGIGVLVAVLLVSGVTIALKKNGESDSHTKTSSSPVSAVSTPTQMPQSMGDSDSLDPVQKGLASTNGKCEGTGSTKMTYAPMAAADIGTIAPMGSYGGSHVTPIDHQYYYGSDASKPADSYPVYAVMDGDLTSMGSVPNSNGKVTNWNVTLAHSCTFMVLYNLMTSISPDIMSQVQSNWREMGGAIKVPVKAGHIIGYMGGQSLDFQVGDTTFVNPKLLYHTAYDNREPFKINTVHPLDYFTSDVAAQILPKYLRVAEPRDGDYAYDVSGQAVGTWFMIGTNGYAGGNRADGTSYEVLGHLALAYDSFDPSTLVVSTGNYNGGSQEFIVKDKTIDWTKITPASGLVKFQLADGSIVKPDGSIWSGGFVSGGLRTIANLNKATLLIQMTDTDLMKVEIFDGKTPAQVSGFDDKASMYNRGQDAHMVKSTTASTPPPNK